MGHVTRTLVVVALALFVLFVALPASANTTVTGEVGSSNEIVTEDGTIYTIADSEKGDELASMVGEIVKVNGTVQETEGVKTITVDSFSIVTE
jgi:hypothetical protein